MNKMEELINRIKEEDIEFVYLLFVDIKGNFRSVQTQVNQIERTISYGFIVNVSNIENYEEEGLINLYPDIDTFTILPWRPQHGRCAAMICQMKKIEGTEIMLDSRNVAEHTMRRCNDSEIIFEIVPSIQFYLFHLDEDEMPTTITHNRAREYEYGRADLGLNVRRDITLTLSDCDILFSSCSAKNDKGLQEINLIGDRLKPICDIVEFTKSACQIIARRHGLYASFIPKPTNDVKGSFMRLQFMCKNSNGKSLFYDENDSNKVSAMGYSFIAGILKYIREISIITNPLINSYKRLAADRIPKYVTWSSNCSDDNAIIHIVPIFLENDVIIQINSVDMASNIYLALPLLIEAGMEGIEKGMSVPAEGNKDLRNESVDIKKMGIERLPSSMIEALNLFKKSSFAKKILGEELYIRIFEMKEREWNEYNKYVSEWEIEKYINEY